MDALLKAWGRLLKVWAIYVVRPLQIRQIARTIEHIHGQANIPYGPDELMVICLVRDGELYVNSFIKHYAQMGVKHVVLLDNGSTDRTIALAKKYANVTILRSPLPFKRYKMALRHYLIRYFGQQDRWLLYVDIDELFDYPYSDIVKLPQFLGYLRQGRYTAVVAYMLDMFSEQPLTAIKSHVEDDLKAIYRLYDIADIVRMDYYFPRNELPTNEIKAYFGGIRRTLFDPQAITGLVLTKHPLFLLDGHLNPLFVHEHSVQNARIADVTAVLFHYKFLGDFKARTTRAVEEESYYNKSSEYKKYLKVIKHNPNVQFIQPTNRRLKSTQELLQNRFLFASPTYTAWAKAQSGDMS